ncbi:MAG: Asp23/Gls24 family envelope stress response protein [Chloroflexota bacterium]
MATRTETLGTIDISPTAVATIASQAINQCYGVVGMASKNLVGGIAQALSRDSKRGIEVAVTGEEIVIDVYVIVEYGTRIRAVAESIQNTVKFHVEKALGLPVKAVNVYVQGLRQSNGKE